MAPALPALHRVLRAGLAAILNTIERQGSVPGAAAQGQLGELGKGLQARGKSSKGVTPWGSLRTQPNPQGLTRIPSSGGLGRPAPAASGTAVAFSSRHPRPLSGGRLRRRRNEMKSTFTLLALTALTLCLCGCASGFRAGAAMRAWRPAPSSARPPRRPPPLLSCRIPSKRQRRPSSSSRRRIDSGRREQEKGAAVLAAPSRLSRACRRRLSSGCSNPQVIVL